MEKDVLPNHSVKISCIGKRNLRIIRFVNGTKKPQEEREMKATGIVRRIDDLGRVVIPKEIRRTMRIREGDPSQTVLTNEQKFCLAMVEISEYVNA